MLKRRYLPARPLVMAVGPTDAITHAEALYELLKTQKWTSVLVYL